MHMHERERGFMRNDYLEDSQINYFMKRIFFLSLVSLFTVIYYTFITLNFELIHWLFHGMGRPMYIVFLNLLFLTPTLLWGAFRKYFVPCLSFLTITVILSWTLSGILDYNSQVDFSKIVEYYKETGFVSLKDFLVLELVVYVLLLGLFLLIKNWYNVHCPINKLYVVVNCFILITLTFYIESPTEISSNAKESNFCIPSESLFLRVIKEGDTIEITIGKDKGLSDNLISFKAKEDVCGVMFAYLPDHSIVFHQQDSASVIIMSGKCHFGNVIDYGEDYVNFRTMAPRIDLSVLKYTKDKSIIHKRAVPY